MENEEITPENLELVQQRKENTELVLGKAASQLWEQLVEVLDDCKVDAILLGGDILDYASTSNIECLKNGLNQLKTPVMYVRADHDYASIWCEGLSMSYTTNLHREIDGYNEVLVLEFSELCVVGINNSTGNISANAVQQIKEIIALKKPIIVLTHVPLNSQIDKSLAEKSIMGWGSALLWGEGCNYVPDNNTREFLELVYEKDSLIKEVVCGHLHFSWDGYLSETAHEHVFSPASEGNIGIIHVCGEE